MQNATNRLSVSVDAQECFDGVSFDPADE